MFLEIKLIILIKNSKYTERKRKWEKLETALYFHLQKRLRLYDTFLPINCQYLIFVKAEKFVWLLIYHYSEIHLWGGLPPTPTNVE